MWILSVFRGLRRALDKMTDLIRIQPRSPYRTMVLVLGVLVCATGLAALCGWITGVAVLTTLGQGLIPMAPSTALLFALNGLALCLRGAAPGSRAARAAGTGLAAAAMAAAAPLLILSSLHIHPAAESLGIPITGSLSGAPLGHMSPVTALCFVLAGLAYVSSDGLKGRRGLKASSLLAGLLFGIVFLFFLAYVLGTPLLYGGPFIPPALTTVLAFLFLSGGMALHSVPLAWPPGPSNDITRRTARVLSLLFAAAAAGILAAGFLYFRSYEIHHRQEVARSLGAVADLKVEELSRWRQERLGDAELFYHNPNFADRARLFTSDPGDPENRRRFLTWLERIRAASRYERVSFYDTRGREILAASGAAAAPGPEFSARVARAAQSGQITFEDFFRIPGSNRIRLAVLVPVLDSRDRALGVLALHIDPDQSLYPMLNRWPMPSRTAEFYLVRRRGARAEFLNNLRFHQNAALNFSVPLDRTDMPAVRAALGRQGSWTGKNYRGLRMLAATRVVPDSPWSITTGMDLSEVYAPVRERLWMMVVLMAVMLLGSGLGAGMVWRRQSESLLRQQLEAADALRRSEEKYRILVENLPQRVFLKDTRSVYVSANQRFAGDWGLTPETIAGKTDYDILPGELADKYRADDQAVMAAGVATTFEEKAVISGRECWVRTTKTPVRDEHGDVTGILGIFFDITDRKQAEESLRKSEERFKSTLENMIEGCQILGFDWTYLYLNETAAAHARMPRESLIGRTMMDVYPGIQDTAMFTALTRCMRERLWQEMQNEFVYADGSSAWFDLVIQPVPEGVFVLSVDITERKQAEQRVEHLNLVLRAIRDINQLIVHEKDPETLIRKTCTLLVEHRGYSGALVILTGEGGHVRMCAEQGLGEQFGDIEETLRRGRLPCCCEQAKARGGLCRVTDRESLCATCVLRGNCAPGQALCTLLEHGGRQYGYLLVIVEQSMGMDEEEQSLFEEMAGDIAFALHGIENELAMIQAGQDRERMEAELRQAQKMEAVGRLAGGIAHDFNNMLTVINTYSELVLSTLPPADPIRADIEQILKAGERSADMTRQLLAFSRRQVLSPEILDINRIVENMEKMIRRLIGEHIEFLTDPGRGLGLTKADPGQIEQVILNLAINARDAMPGGGRLTIQTAVVALDDAAGPAPGPYVALRVSDTGCGMDEATRERIFDPFFTTKDVGKGTGLGLATVYGIITQSGGHIRVFSEPGQGATFEILLPQAAESEAGAKPLFRDSREPGGHETILVVEDEKGVRDLVKRLLADAGYSVLTAGHGEQALDLCRGLDRPVDLLITDVVMPGMSGRDLASRIMEIYPGIKVLFMSGYAESAIVHHGVLETGIHFLPKPFSLTALYDKVRQALDA